MAINDNYLSTLPFYHLDDISFTMLIYEQSHGPLNLNDDRLDSLFFNPITQPKLNDIFSTYLDPDSNFSFYPPDGKYMVEDEIRE